MTTGIPTAKDLKFLRWAVSGASIFSTCSRRQYMAILIDQFGHLLGSGYNGSPAGYGHCMDGACPRATSDSLPGSSYANCVAVHAELNCLHYSDYTQRRGATLVVNGTPCWDCARSIANSAIARLVYLVDEPRLWDQSKSLLEAVGIELVAVTSEELAHG